MLPRCRARRRRSAVCPAPSLALSCAATMANNAALPLARFSVLDLTRARAGPTCVRQLVDWGARAIKIELPGGRTGAGMGGNRHGFDFQHPHRNQGGMTLKLRERA